MVGSVTTGVPIGELNAFFTALAVTQNYSGGVNFVFSAASSARRTRVRWVGYLGDCRVILDEDIVSCLNDCSLSWHVDLRRCIRVRGGLLVRSHIRSHRSQWQARRHVQLRCVTRRLPPAAPTGRLATPEQCVPRTPLATPIYTPACPGLSYLKDLRGVRISHEST